MEDKLQESNFELCFRIEQNRLIIVVENKDSKTHPVSPQDYIIALFGEIVRMSDMCDIPVHEAIAMAQNMFHNKEQLQERLVNERPPTNSRH